RPRGCTSRTQGGHLPTSVKCQLRKFAKHCIFAKFISACIPRGVTGENRLEDSPFRSGWWGPDLGEVRHRGAIIPPYGCYDFSDLPAIPYRLSGSFDWLSDARPQSRNIGEQRSKENATAFVQLQSICEL